ncbi:2Fe-2S iron-sulfur cluster-binding protein [Microvirga sesbaniae]|uniref:2Fe-2S iron-sulfur cluster-binding protein n=1 Tax=Microvirga sesbaniae TaxID=681392 RepID=UPI0021C6C94D|nr:2Fe-2S iron-sulfur cluster-binding protein [Microvirga sp. HBU67692]
MSFTVTVANTSSSFEVAEDTTIIQAAVAAGVAYPYGCQVGRCGSCKSRLIEGEVDHLPHTPFSLTEKDKQSGFILACRSRPRSNCTVAWLGSDTANHPLRQEAGQVVHLERAAPDITVVQIRLDAEAPLQFSAGQYAELTFANCPPRHYSMANQPGSDTLEFHVRHVPDGSASSYVAQGLKVGDSVFLRGPIGTAHLRPRQTRPIVAVAGGSGLAPILSILGAAAALKLTQPIHLYFAARSTDDLYREEQIQALTENNPNIAYTPVVANKGEGGNRERLRRILATDLADLRGWQAYLAGSPQLVDGVTEILVHQGLSHEHCHADAFFTAAEKASILEPS